MSTVETKNVVSFYKVDKFLFNAGLPNDKIIVEIMTHSKGYKPETKMQVPKRNEYGIFMYYQHQPVEYAKWEYFFSGVLKTPNDTFYGIGRSTRFKGNYLSFVCFFEKGADLFAICVGKAYLAIDRFIEHDFGFSLLTRLIKPDSNLLRQLSANHLAGATFEDISSFRSSESFLSQDDFGKIFKQAISELDKTALTSLGIDTTEISKANCLAKSSFTLKSGVTLNNITDKILPSLSKLFDGTHGPNFQMNKVKEITKRDLLFPQLMSELYEKIRTDFDSFDFFSPDETLNFLTAHKYTVVRYGRDYGFEKGEYDLINAANVRRILDDEHLVDFSDPRIFVTEFTHIMINAFDEADTQALQQKFSLIRGLHGELEHKGHKYFWLNGKFWQIDRDFLKYFNDKVFDSISEPAYRKLDHAIGFNTYNLSSKQPEDDYNSKQGKEPGFMNLDKKVANGVELCDLLYEETDCIYLIHVKKGFDRSVRDLTSQVLTAARFLNEDRTINEYVKKVYHFKKGDKISITEAAFLKKFKKRAVFVFAFVSDKDIFDKKQFAKLNSNIAKLELFELLKSFKNFNPPYELKIIQLPSK